MNKSSNFDKLTDLFLYMASRNENYINLISKSKGKKVILIDRFTDSTIAYQHYAMGINLNLIKQFNKVILKNNLINFTFLHTVTMKNLKKRLKKRLNLNRYDTFSNNFYSKAQNGFMKLAKNKKNYMVIDSNKSIIENKDRIISKVNQLIK